MSAYEEGQKLTWIATPYVFTANGVNASGGGNNILLEYLLRDIVVSSPNSGSSIPGVSLIAEAPSLPVWPTIGLLLLLPACALIVGIILSKKKVH
ncbi:MAG: hypothetical protein IJJ23_03785 [Clostridia bacterium]|nr:hypothetical protein [Clostridia bacterium]